MQMDHDLWLGPRHGSHPRFLSGINKFVRDLMTDEVNFTPSFENINFKCFPRIKKVNPDFCFTRSDRNSSGPLDWKLHF